MSSYRAIEMIIKAFLFPKLEENYLKEVQRNTIDWQALLGTLSKHKLLLPAFQVANAHDKKLPIFPALHRYQRQQVRYSLFKLKELKRTISAFDAKGILISTYKGLAFAQAFYHGFSNRASVDVDMAIAEADIPASITLMQELGYQEYTKAKNQKTTDPNMLSRSRAHQIDYSWVLYQGEQIMCNIELHWQPAHPVLKVPLRFDQLPTNAYTSISVSGVSIATFTKPYLAIFTIIHHGLIDTWGQYRHLLDLAMILRGLSPKEYKEVQSLLQQYKLTQTFYVGLFLLDQIVDFSVADENYQASKHQQVGQRLLKELRNNTLAGKWSDNPKKLLYHLQLRDTWREQLVTGGNLIWFKMRF